MDDRLEKLLHEGITRHLRKSRIEDRDTIIPLIDTFFPWTSRIDLFFCNSIMFESIELLKNSIILFESGYYDAALYSLRQSVENMNNMLLISEDEEAFKHWYKKDKFPTNERVKAELKKRYHNYLEIKNALPTWEDKYDRCTKEANKYIHKQGYDTFYENYKDDEKVFKKINDFFNKYLKFTIVEVCLIYIALNPMALLLADQDIASRIHVDLADDPIPLEFIYSVIDEGEFNKIKETDMYQSFKEQFYHNEPLNYGTELLMKYQIVNYDGLDEIKTQAHLLTPIDKLVYDVASITEVSYIFFSSMICMPYSTSIKPNKEIYEYFVGMFDSYLINNVSNQSWNDMYLNIFLLSNNEYLVLLSNNPLSPDTINNIDKAIRDYIDATLNR